MATKYYSKREQVPLGPGETLAYADGKGYWAKPTPDKPYNPQAYVPGGSSPTVAKAIQNEGYANPGSNPVMVPQHPTGAGSDYQNSGVQVGEKAPAPAKPEGAATAATADEAIDWRAYLTNFGFSDEIVQELDRIFSTTKDTSYAIALGQAYIRGTEWYAKEFPGIQSGINKGLFSDERGYQAYKNQVDQVLGQYYDRPATPAEVGAYLQAGKGIAQIQNELQSQAIQGNLNDPMKAWFTPDELKAYSDQAAGIDTALGQRIAAEADLAVRVNGLYKDFFGRTVSRDELNGLFSDGATAEDVAKKFATEANINAMNPAISHLFSTEEIQQMALSRAGGVTQNGQKLADIAELAAQLNQVAHVYNGQGITREEVMAAYEGGLSADQVRRNLEAGTITGALPDFLGGVFSMEELRLIGEEQSGASSSAEGKRLVALTQSAQDFNQVFEQYMGRKATRQELEGYFAAGTTATQAAQRFAAGQFADALPKGAAAYFTPEELALAGAQSSGASQSAQGARILNQIQNAGQYGQVAATYGVSLTRQQLDEFYDKSVSPDAAARIYAAGQFGAALPQAARGLFTAEELQQAGSQQTGAAQSVQGQRLLNLVSSAADYQAVATQYNQPLSRQDLEGFYDQNVTVDTYARQQSGQAYANANRGDIQYAAGAFGSGQLSEAELTALGQQQAGLDTPLGQKLAAARAKANRSMDAVFRGVLANPALQLNNGRLSGPQKRPDVGA